MVETDTFFYAGRLKESTKGKRKMVDVSPLRQCTSTSNGLAPSKPLGSLGLDSFVGQLLNNVGDLFSSSSVSAAHN